MEAAKRIMMNGKPVFEVPSRTVVNFKSGFGKKLLCDDLTFTTGNACVFSCAFCYVDSMQRKSMDWYKKHGVEYPTEGHLGVVIRTKDAVEIARRQIMSKPEAFRMEKRVIYSSPKVDVAGNMGLVRETVAVCKVILEHTKWDIRLLSKSSLLPKVAVELNCSHVGHQNDAYKRIIYGVSTGTLDDNLAAAFEQGTAKVSKRIESLHWLQDNGFRTFGMICPSLPQRDYTAFADEMHATLRADRCEHVWAEPLNVRGQSMENTCAALSKAGYATEAAALRDVSDDKMAWEVYARQTFLAHAPLYRPGQLRFLQYVNNDNRAWWSDRVEKGSVLL